jgi:hypothetical protein
LSWRQRFKKRRLNVANSKKKSSKTYYIEFNREILLSIVALERLRNIGIEELHEISELDYSNFRELCGLVLL